MDEDTQMARWRIAHLTTADISLALLLETEIAERVKEGHTVPSVSAPGPNAERVNRLGVTHPVTVPEFSRSWGLRQDVRGFFARARNAFDQRPVAMKSLVAYRSVIAAKRVTGWRRR